MEDKDKNEIITRDDKYNQKLNELVDEAIDIDECDKDLQSKYNISTIPTMVLLGDNDEVLNKWFGVTKSSTINGFIKGLTQN